MIGKWQRLQILHCADPGMFPGINHQRARGPNCVWVPWAIFGRGCSREETGQDAEGDGGNPPAFANVTQVFALKRYHYLSDLSIIAYCDPNAAPIVRTSQNDFRFNGRSRK